MPNDDNVRRQATRHVYWGLRAWENDDAARVALASALSHHVRVLGQGHVNDAALIWWHRLKLDRRSSRNDATREAHGKVAKEHLATRAVAVDIDGDANVLPESLVDHDAHDELDGAERLAAPSDQVGSIRCAHVERERFELAHFNVRLIEVHVMEKLAEDSPRGLGNGGCLTGRLVASAIRRNPVGDGRLVQAVRLFTFGEQADADVRLPRAKAKDTSWAPGIKDNDTCLGPTDAE